MSHGESSYRDGYEQLTYQSGSVPLTKHGSLRDVEQMQHAFFLQDRGLVELLQSLFFNASAPLPELSLVPIPVVTTVTPQALYVADLLSWLACGSAVATLLLIGRATRILCGTTLVAPCGWAMVSVVCVGLVATFASLDGALPSPGMRAIRFCAAVSTLCPAVAVLGAKRPQDRGWQWVVFSLWVVLVWPAIQAVLSRDYLELFIAWKLFLLGLVAIGLLNFLPTRYWFAAVLVAAGQVVLLSEYLVEIPAQALDWVATIGILSFLLAGGVVMLRRRPVETSKEEAQEGLAPFDREWQRFRDGFGVLWGLRILGRVNETAQLRGWPMRLAWNGFESPDEVEPSDEDLAQLEETMKTLLRRFV